MGTINTRLFKISTPRDTKLQNTKWVNSGVQPSSAKFTTGFVNSRSFDFINDQFIYSSEESISLSGEFSIGLWVKFNNINYENTVDHLVYLSFEDGDIVIAYMPAAKLNGGTIDYLAWHYISITRDTANLITFKLDGTSFYTETNNKALDLNSNSFILIASGIETDTHQNTVYADDILLSNTSDSFVQTQPTTYYDISDYDFSEYYPTSIKIKDENAYKLIIY